MIFDAALTIAAMVMVFAAWGLNRVICAVIASNFVICLIINFALIEAEVMPYVDPLYFAGYVIVDLIYIRILYSFTEQEFPLMAGYVFLASLVYNCLVTLEYWPGISLFYDFRPIFMGAICIIFVLMGLFYGRGMGLLNGVASMVSGFSVFIRGYRLGNINGARYAKKARSQSWQR